MEQVDSVLVLEAVARLLDIAARDTGHSRRVADFLLAWHDASENGGWDPTDLWQLDEPVGKDVLSILRSLPAVHKYPDDLGFERVVDFTNSMAVARTPATKAATRTRQEGSRAETIQ